MQTIRDGQTGGVYGGRSISRTAGAVKAMRRQQQQQRQQQQGFDLLRSSLGANAASSRLEERLRNSTAFTPRAGSGSGSGLGALRRAGSGGGRTGRTSSMDLGSMKLVRGGLAEAFFPEEENGGGGGGGGGFREPRPMETRVVFRGGAAAEAGGV